MWGWHPDLAALAAWIALAVTIGATLALATPAPQILRIPLGLDAYMPVPEDNAITSEKIALGRRLFFDTGLSRDGRTSCSSCHQSERAFADGRPVSVGVFGRQGVRSVPTLVNRGYGTTQFWDGRRATLEDQVLDPIQDQREMDGALSLEAVIDFYDRGGNPNPSIDPEVRPLGLSPGEKAALASFLRALTGIVSDGDPRHPGHS